MVLLTKAMSIYFEVNPSKFLPVTGSKIKIDECTLLGSSRTHVGATTNLSKTFYYMDERVSYRSLTSRFAPFLLC